MRHQGTAVGTLMDDGPAIRDDTLNRHMAVCVYSLSSIVTNGGGVHGSPGHIRSVPSSDGVARKESTFYLVVIAVRMVIIVVVLMVVVVMPM